MTVEWVRQHPLVSFLRNPARAGNSLNASAWGNLLRAARRSNLLSRAACLSFDRDLTGRLPQKIRFHFQSAARVADSSRQSTLREVRHIHDALAPTGIPCILLKGAAYVACGVDAGKGRLLSDIDIMLPHDRLTEAEFALIKAGWMTTKIDNYDQRYYRQWMHELPPMQHLERGTNIDVHHTILPPTARLKPDASLLWANARSLKDYQNFFVLAPTDMIIHSATHLFHEGEFPNGLRDIFDMDALLRQFSTDTNFWTTLIERATLLDLQRPLYYALRYCQQVAGTPIPADIMRQAETAAPHRITRRLMDWIILRSIGSVLEDRQQASTAIALFAMYVRSHYLRMPIKQLVQHLLHKQFISSSR